MMPGYTLPVANHLWQSTVFAAAAAGLLTLALQKNHASVRYSIWLAGSLKFLMPFTLLVSAGSWMQWPTTRAATAAVRPISHFVEDIGQPFVPGIGSTEGRPAEQRRAIAPIVLPAIWLCGFLAAGLAWFRKWRAVRAAVRSATRVPSSLPMEVMLSRGSVEPGVVGLWRPVLLLPEGITDRLTPVQFEAVVKHELCHVRRRDNLAAAVHMVVETIFWFHPLIYWIGKRMIEERERSCDEAVVRSGSEPEAYAEGILNVCRFYLESPMACASGVTGGDLKKRIEGIMSQRMTKDLNFGKRVLLGAAAALVVAAPVAIGVLHGQTKGAAAGKFEVASVKASTGPETRFGDYRTEPGGRITATNVPLFRLITEAYNVSFQSMRLSGAPEWTYTARYDVDARAEKGAIPVDLPGRVRDEKMRPMLQALLADRFKLVVRTEHKELPVYVVTVAKGGPKVEKSEMTEDQCDGDDTCHQFMGGQGRGVHGKAVTIDDLAAFVENWSDRPMINRTELRGLYKMDSDGWVPMRGPGGGGEGLDDSTRPTIFTVFEKQLGLKLESQKAPVDLFVIEHVEKPTGN